ncbi:hypothetical protein ASF63_14405 [Microbacterium sp. Leaf320]|nr:hypothetical protein ASF63_14405 [Microbacterium sp. Leaf320]
MPESFDGGVPPIMDLFSYPAHSGVDATFAGSASRYLARPTSSESLTEVAPTRRPQTGVVMIADYGESGPAVRQALS